MANADVVEKGASGDENLVGMGSTLAVALIRAVEGAMELITAHVGDSRVYLQRNGALRLLTKDHTQVWWKVESKAIDEEVARRLPDASILTRAVGQSLDLMVEVSEPIRLADGDGVLICSDGLSGAVSREEINRTIMARPQPKDCVSALHELAMASGSTDNITVEFVRIGSFPAAMPLPRRQTVPDQRAVGMPELAARPKLAKLAVTSRSESAAGAPPAAAPAKRPFTLLFLGLLMGLGLAAAGVFVFDRIFVKSPAPNLPMVVAKYDPLKKSIANLDSESIKLNQSAVEGSAAVGKLLKDFDDLAKTAGQPPALRGERTIFEAKVNDLRTGYANIRNSTIDLLNQVRTYRQDAAEVVKRNAQADPAIQDVLKKVNLSLAALKQNQADFEKLRASQGELSKKMTELNGQWSRKEPR